MKTSIKITKSVLDKINEKRTIGVEFDDKGNEKTTYVEHNDFQNFMLDCLSILEETATGKTKAEIHLKKMLIYGHDRSITASELRVYTGVNLNTCKELLIKYEVEVNKFNSKF